MEVTMGERIISAARDDSGRGAVSLYGRETALDGQRRNTEVWHIPRELEPNRPLCGVNLAGTFKVSKGYANCSQCRVNASLQAFDQWRYAPVLRALYAGQEPPPYENRWTTHEGLFDADLVADKRGKLVLTSRGKVVALDIIEPVGWLDPKTRLFHARKPVSLETICGIQCGLWSTFVDQINELHIAVKKSGRRTVTCVRCAVHVERRADVD